MSQDVLSGPQFFNDDARRAAYQKSPTRPGHDVFWGVRGHKYRENPFHAHIPPPTPIHGQDEGGEFTKYQTHHGIPDYNGRSNYEMPTRTEQVPLNRLESLQNDVSHTQASRYRRRKGEAPPIDVDHYVNEDRYVITEGNHRSTAALLNGQQMINARVAKVYTNP